MQLLCEAAMQHKQQRRFSTSLVVFANMVYKLLS